jgi:hypothetical protein
MGVSDRDKRYGPEKDHMGAHARLYDQIVNSHAWSALSFTARALYVQMRVKLKQTNNGNIEATAKTLSHSGFGSPSTLSKALRELQTVELIEKTRQGGIAAGGKLCSLYRFTDKETWEHTKNGIKATKPSLVGSVGRVPSKRRLRSKLPTLPSDDRNVKTQTSFGNRIGLIRSL